MDGKNRVSICPHCGTPDSKRMGECAVCGRVVCERCGNVQFAAGKRKVLHRECLRKDDGSFKMIKFVR